MNAHLYVCMYVTYFIFVWSQYKFAVEDIEFAMDIAEINSNDGVGDSLHYDPFVVMMAAGDFIDANDVANLKSSSLYVPIGIASSALELVVIIVIIVVVVVVIM